MSAFPDCLLAGEHLRVKLVKLPRQDIMPSGSDQADVRHQAFPKLFDELRLQPCKLDAGGSQRVPDNVLSPATAEVVSVLDRHIDRAKARLTRFSMLGEALAWR